ncbi:MAG TPA: zinc-ribbon and DUF3426 domain-containing protein [Steroidobacteraceae bacterium]
MFTVCSKCNLRLTVTATDLRAAQGYVRCGRCHNVFNALAALADDPARVAEQTSAADTQSRQALTPPAPEPPPAAPSAPETARKPEILTDTFATDTSLEFNPASTNINEVFIEAAAGEHTGTFESIILGGEELAAEESFEEQNTPAQAQPEPPAAPPPPANDEISFMADWSAPMPSAAAPPGVNAAAATEIAEALQATDATAAASAEGPAPAALEAVLLDPARAPARVPRWVPQAAAGMLALGLLAQGVNHYRDDLADTSALHRPLTAIYRSLGRPLEPRWDVASYEVRQLGASADAAAPGDLVVRASISNRAKRVQPLPLLRVVMQDRFGNRVAARDLQPAEYLGRGAPPVSLMAPGQRVDVQVAFQDPGRAATGFEIDACMARSDRTVTCANDPGSR